MQLLILGLDGLSANMIQRFDPNTPFISQVRDEGVAGDLRSVNPPATFPAWTSFATGLDPSSHGVTNMVKQQSDYSTPPTTGNQSDQAIYDFLDNAALVNLQGSYGRVPSGDDTTLVTGKLAPDKSEAVPEHLHGLPSYEQYQVFKDDAFVGTGKHANPEAYVDHLNEIIDSKYAFADAVFEAEEPDVGFVLFSAIDWLSHFLGEAESETQAEAWFTRLIEQVDDYAANLAADAENVVLVSDHGFEEKEYTVHINEWLRDKGYIAESQIEGGSNSAIDLLYEIVSQSSLARDAAQRVYGLLQKMDADITEEIADAQNITIDHSRSVAWDIRDGCIYLNDERFADPQVDADEREAIINELINGLSDITLNDGRPAFRDVVRADKVYASPSGMVPDILARPARGVKPAQTQAAGEGYVTSTTKWEHRYDGIFAASGPLFESSATVERMNLIDVLPTLLHALDQPISPRFDGEVYTDVVATTRDPLVLDENNLPLALTSSDDESQPGTEDVVKERLEDLGYV